MPATAPAWLLTREAVGLAGTVLLLPLPTLVPVPSCASSSGAGVWLRGVWQREEDDNPAEPEEGSGGKLTILQFAYE